MIAGHLTVTYALRQGLRTKFPAVGRLHLPALLAGAFLPDLLDKPFSYALNLPGRGIAHSIFVLALLFYTLSRVFPQHRNIVAALLVGSVMHLIEDLPYPHIFLWPMLGEWQFNHHYGFLESIRRYYSGGFDATMTLLLALEVISYPFFFYYLLRTERRAEPAVADASQAA